MMKLADVFLSNELSKLLSEKQKQYNQNHPDDILSIQKMAELLLEIGIRFIDVSSID